MMRPHCDRCGIEIEDGYQKWVEDNASPLDAFGKPMVGAGTNPIWHITINGGGDVSRQIDKMLCRSCWIIVLVRHIKELGPTALDIALALK